MNAVLDVFYDAQAWVRWQFASLAWAIDRRIRPAGLPPLVETFWEWLGYRLEADYCYCAARHDGEGHRPHGWTYEGQAGLTDGEESVEQK